MDEVRELVNHLLDMSHERRIQVHVEGEQLNQFIELVYRKYKVTKLTIGYNPNIDAFTVVVDLWA